ncbi:MAG: hypothetical protein RRA51_03865 [Armatimonadota bacterium]|nr:hypothetical protein [Armatimonadota bacterium]
MAKLEGASSDAPKFFGSAGALPSRNEQIRLLKRTALQFCSCMTEIFRNDKNRASTPKPFATRYSPFAVVFGINAKVYGWHHPFVPESCNPIVLMPS